MPRIGTPSSNTCAGARGEFASVVDSGPPERMTARGAKRAISAGSWSHAQISQYTPISRTRRAMSCVYCAPKSRIRMRSRWMSGADETGVRVHFSDAFMMSISSPKKCTLTPVSALARASLHAVVRRLFRDRDVVHVALAHAGARHANELGLALHVRDGAAADIAHARAEAADQLVHDAAQRPAVRDASLDAFGHELVDVGRVLEIAILRPLLHGAEGPHAAVALVGPALVQLDLA